MQRSLNQPIITLFSKFMLMYSCAAKTDAFNSPVLGTFPCTLHLYIHFNRRTPLSKDAFPQKKTCLTLNSGKESENMLIREKSAFFSQINCDIAIFVFSCSHPNLSRRLLDSSVPNLLVNFFANNKLR